MSGGVDSSVAAYLLKEQGYDIAGATMCMGLDSPTCSDKRCCSPLDLEDARKVCDHLEIPHYSLDFSENLKEYVINNFIEEYIEGRTPNPCVRCNQYLKFHVLLKKALVMDFDYIATGHYALVEKKDSRLYLKTALDANKDQSYFLYSTEYNMLDKILFPLGDLPKNEVRDIARTSGVPVAEKRESQDICFLGDDSIYNFFESRSIAIEKGSIVNAKGEEVGKHNGIIGYTIGQRKGIGGGFNKPQYVIEINSHNNTVVIGSEEDLYSKGMIVSNINLLVKDLPDSATVKTRYRMEGAHCTIKRESESVIVEFSSPQRAISPGQSAVFYHNDIVLGGGIIEKKL